MLIDWFTVFAQLVNFLVLMWLLRRFLYRPVLNAIAAREKGLQAERDAAGQARKQAEIEARQLADARAEFERQRQQLLEDAMADARAERQRWLDAARRELLAMQAQSRQSIAAEYQRLQQDLVQKTIGEVYAVTDKLVRDLANAQLENLMAEQLLARLPDAGQVVLPDGEAWTIVSTFALSDQVREKLAAGIHRHWPASGVVQFQQLADLLCGLELRVGGYRLAWNAADYLQALQQQIAKPIDVAG